jgi:AraC-like DNA-binding protein
MPVETARHRPPTTQPKFGRHAQPVPSKRAMPALVRNAITVTHAAGPEPIEIHRGVSVTHAHPKHWHEEYHFCAITGGAGYTVYRGNAHFTPTGSMFLLPPGEVHSNYATANGCSYTNIYLPASRVERAATQINPVGGPTLPLVILNADVQSSFLNMCAVLNATDSQLHRDAAFLAFFEALMNQSGKRKKSPDSSRESSAVTLAREFLDENYDRDIGLERLSELTELSPYHLNRIFRREVGMPPHAYQIQRRIARAKVLLRQDWPIADVAHHTGFADQSHFTRHFKRMVGVTPGQFVPDRKNVQDVSFAAD